MAEMKKEAHPAVRMRAFIGVVGAVSLGFLSGCVSSANYYTNPEAQWATIQRVGVSPFVLAFDNPVRRQVVTQLFTEELRKTRVVEVVEIPADNPEMTPVPPTMQQLAAKYQVDAVFTGAVDDSQGAVVHVQLHDPATQDILWSGTYSLGVGAEFFSVRTQQQQFQRSIRKLARQFAARKR